MLINLWRSIRNFSIDYPTLWLMMRYVVLPAAAASIFVASGGAATIPALSSEVILHQLAVFALATVLVSAVTNIFSALISGLAMSTKGSNEEKPATLDVPQASSTLSTSTGTILQYAATLPDKSKLAQASVRPLTPPEQEMELAKAQLLAQVSHLRQKITDYFQQHFEPSSRQCVGWGRMSRELDGVEYGNFTSLSQKSIACYLDPKELSDSNSQAYEINKTYAALRDLLDGGISRQLQRIRAEQDLKVVKEEIAAAEEREERTGGLINHLNPNR